VFVRISFVELSVSQHFFFEISSFELSRPLVNDEFGLTEDGDVMLGVEAEGADVDDGFVDRHLLKFITTHFKRNNLSLFNGRHFSWIF
jgi:hypothetical protein